MNNSSRTHIPVLDSLRAFAALSVCLFHFVCTTTGYIQTDCILNVFSIGQYGVQLFFVISGFVIPWAMYHAGYRVKNFFSFFLKRISRLEPPYIFSIILALVVLYMRENFLGKSNDHINLSAMQVALHIGYLIPFVSGYKWLNQVYWTLAIEFQYYLFIALLFVPLIKSTRIIRAFMYALVLGASIICPEKFLFYWLPVFLLGILLFLFKARVIFKQEYYISSVAVMIFCIYQYPLASVIFAVIPLICILFFSDFKIMGLNVLGKFSYSIYLIHPILGASLINILSHRFTDPIEKVAVIILGIVFTIFSAWIMYLLIEKPSKSISASINYKGK